MPKRRSQMPLVTVSDFEAAAEAKMSYMAREYLQSGAADEITLRRNRSIFESLLLKPRALCDVSHLDTSLNLFGLAMPHPLLLSPTAYTKLFHKDGELAVAEGAAQTKTVYTVSSFSTTSMEKVAARATYPLWFQLYTPPDRAISSDLLKRAEDSGYKAICATIDVPVLGTRNREMRSAFHMPRGMIRENLRKYGKGLTRSAHFSNTGVTATSLDASLTWNYVDWMRSNTKLPILLKGILSPEDAKLAVEHGAHGIIVSNHGARNLDTLPCTLEALPGVVTAVGGKIPVLFDGGIRRGTDIFKALALGAKAALIGRPYVYGVVVSGAAGVARLIEILLEELRVAMSICGRPNLASIDRSVLWNEFAP
ncbi:MAG TPA: alpha-hydroxy acid oxidase [Candidatus Dormibacteraeota bacterium]|nr:alpha-hydroxy acid oxidase [Candidatus Dormibacteraeota bacterium]